MKVDSGRQGENGELCAATSLLMRRHEPLRDGVGQERVPDRAIVTSHLLRIGLTV